MTTLWRADQAVALSSLREQLIDDENTAEAARFEIAWQRVRGLLLDFDAPCADPDLHYVAYRLLTELAAEWELSRSQTLEQLYAAELLAHVHVDDD